MLVKEILNNKIDYEVTKQTSSMFVTKAEIGDRVITFAAIEENDRWELEFSEKKNNKRTYDKSGSGNELEVFSMVKDSILEFISIYHPREMYFDANKTKDSPETKNDRANLYDKLIKRFKIPGYSFSRKNVAVNTPNEYATFVITRDN